MVGRADSPIAKLSIGCSVADAANPLCEIDTLLFSTFAISTFSLFVDRNLKSQSQFARRFSRSTSFLLRCFFLHYASVVKKTSQKQQRSLDGTFL